MPVDASIAMNVPQVQIANPMDMATKALTLKNLGQQSQAQDQQFQDQQSMRNAFKQNINPDGTINRSGVLNALGQTGNGKAVMDYGKMFQDQDLDKLKYQSQAGKELAWSVRDQDSLTNAKQRAVQMGLPGADKIPDNFNDPNSQKIIQDWQTHSLDGDKQLDHHIAQQNLEVAQGTLNEKKRENNLTDARLQNDKYNSASQETLQALQQTRGVPAVAQAEKDIYAAKKADRLATMVGDPNKMSPQMYHLYTGEVGKIATGGQPTLAEFEGMDPSTFKGALASTWQKVTSDPSPANLGSFVKQYQDYTHSVVGDAKQTISDNYGRVLGVKKAALRPSDYGAFKDQYLDRFMNDDKQPTPGAQQAGAAQAPGTKQAGAPPQAPPPKVGATKDWNGVTYVMNGTHWVPQSSVAGSQ